MHSAGFRFKPQLALEVLSIIIHVIVAVASLFASMVIPGNSIDPQMIYVSDSKHVQLFQLAYQPYAFHKH